MIPVLQEAIYNALDSALACGVYDFVPDGTAYPYVVVGSDTAIEFDTDDTNGLEVTVTIHAWSQYAGMYEVAVIMDSIYDALHNADLYVSGYNIVSCLQEYSETMTESDGLTRHGVQRFRILMHEYDNVT
jgi:hypothetical protein